MEFVWLEFKSLQSCDLTVVVQYLSKGKMNPVRVRWITS
jgi:hypothetical protein